ncbi:MAG: virulence RhuM family protein [Treponema sp.]|nr:virulence RhuM family protein [Treponema sp.]
MNEKEIILFESADKSVSLSVPYKNETVWLNRQQMASLFDRDVKTIGKHVNNAIEEELKGISVVANFATTASDGKVYDVEYYNLDVIISVGYRVKSKRGIEFRYFLNKNGLLFKNGVKQIEDNTLVAITIMIAESKPEEKEIMVNLVMQFLTD